MSERAGPLVAFSGLIDLASAAVGGRAIGCSDEWFASVDHLVRPEPPVFDPSAYGERGKIVDGWETRRKRVGGHDWAIVALGVPGRVRGVDVDTSHFLGNHPPFASLDATVAPADATLEHLRDEATWTRLLPEIALKRGSHNLAAVAHEGRFTHVRLNVYPDGGVARLRILGDPLPDLVGEVDLACLTSGGRPLACSDMFFSPMENLLLPGPAANMGGGWETRRSRPPGEDWIVVRLGRPGVVDRVVVDTAHFKGNYPDRCAIDALYWPDAPAHALVTTDAWAEIVPPSKLRMHEARELPVDPARRGPFTHVRLRIWPDGGVSRLRVLGRPTDATPADDDPLLRLLADADEATFLRCCASRRWARAMVAGAPYTSRAHLFGHAEQVWWHLGDADWLEAFAAHPRIGDRAGGWSAAEQAGVDAADAEVRRALADGNAAYARRFGHVFLVCATGLSAEEMLARLRDRIDNDPAAELRVAAGEQARITRLRLLKLEP